MNTVIHIKICNRVRSIIRKYLLLQIYLVMFLFYIFSHVSSDIFGHAYQNIFCLVPPDLFGHVPLYILGRFPPVIDSFGDVSQQYLGKLGLLQIYN